jgi:xanthine dehydrogenase/oxidase
LLLGYVAQELNFHEEGYETHYGQIVEECRTQRVWEQLKASCEFDKRCSDVEAFNAQHRWKKRGVAMVPTKFGISFTTKFLNQVLGLRKKRPSSTCLLFVPFVFFALVPPPVGSTSQFGN